MGVKTRTGSQDGFKRAVLCTLCVSVGGDIRLNRLQNIVFHFYRNKVVQQKVCHDQPPSSSGLSIQSMIFPNQTAFGLEFSGH